MQGFAAGLMLSISFLDLAHNAMNSIGFLKGNLWVSYILSVSFKLPCITPSSWSIYVLSESNIISAMMQFFAGVVFFAVVANFIPEPTLSQSSEVKSKKVWIIFVLYY